MYSTTNISVFPKHDLSLLKRQNSEHKTFDSVTNQMALSLCSIKLTACSQAQRSTQMCVKSAAVDAILPALGHQLPAGTGPLKT